MRDTVREGICLRQGGGGRPLGDVKGGKEPGRDRPLGRVCHARETVSAKARGRNKPDFARTSFGRAGKIEHLLLCLQRVNSGDVVAWDVAFFPGGQGSSLPPLPRPEDRREQRSQKEVGIPWSSWTPQPWPRIPSQPQEADRVRGRVTTVLAPSLHSVVRAWIFTTAPLCIQGSRIKPGPCIHSPQP